MSCYPASACSTLGPGLFCPLLLIMTSTLPKDEPIAPVRIGAGSFATAYVLRGGPLAFKVVHFPENGETLRKEFIALQEVYSLCNPDSLFWIPRPLAYYDARNNILIQTPSPFTAPRSRRVGMTRPPLVTAKLFRPLRNPNPVYVMDRVFALPHEVGEPICSRYFPSTITAGPSLCRLYFGKTFDCNGERPFRFVNTNNFPLDIQRFGFLRHSLEDLDLPSAEEIALEMGDMLARIYWRAGYDARDVEFVMGGDGYSGVTFYVIDYNQVWFYSLSLPLFRG